MLDLTLPLPCAGLLPHREAMLLACGLLEYQPGAARVSAVVGGENLFLDASGGLDAMAIVEIAAQATAAFKGYEALLRGEPVRIGYLVGIKDFAFSGGPARAGDRLDARVRLEFAMEQAALMTAEVHRGDELLAAGTIKIWEEISWPERAGDGGQAGLGSGGEDAERTASASGLLPLACGSDTDPIAQAVAAACEGIEAGPAANQVVAGFCFGCAFPGFRGHFPGYPLLPAVIMPRLALLPAAAHLGRPCALRRIAQAKIGQGIFPGDHVRVEVSIDSAEAESMTLKARINGPRGVVASFTLECDGLARRG